MVAQVLQGGVTPLVLREQGGQRLAHERHARLAARLRQPIQHRKLLRLQQQQDLRELGLPHGIHIRAYICLRQRRAGMRYTVLGHCGGERLKVKRQRAMAVAKIMLTQRQYRRALGTG